MASKTPFKVLVLSKTSDYRHTCIPAAHVALQSLALISQASSTPSPAFTATSTEDAESHITPSSLSNYKTIVFLQTSGEFLGPAELDALKGYIRGGGGFVGVHCASAGMYSSPWYAGLVGAWFDNHPEPQNGVLSIENPDHYLSAPWLQTPTSSQTTEQADEQSGKIGGIPWFDEWYNFKSHPRSTTPSSSSSASPDDLPSSQPLKILMTVDESSYTGSSHGADHPIAWCRQFSPEEGGARTFYTSLGHFDEAYEDERFLEQLRRAILWTAKVESTE